MIELLINSRCIQCNQCVNVCPTNVFEKVDGGNPIIANQNQCQTCYMCELYCPADALFVAPQAFSHVPLVEEEVLASGLVGSYKNNIGWGKGRKNTAKLDKSYILLRKA